MATRTKTITRVEDSASLAHLRKNYSDTQVKLTYFGERDVHETTVGALEFGERAFIATFATNEPGETSPITQTTWTLTWIPALPLPATWAGPRDFIDDARARAIHQGGGLHIYTFYCDD